MTLTKHKGVSIQLADGETYVIPALTLRHVQVLQERLVAYTGELDAASVELVLDTVSAALSRNYPAITRDTVADLLDLSNMGAVMKAVMGASGLVEVDSSGEAVATA